MFKSFSEIVRTWPTQKALAEAMGNVARAQVQKWAERDFIPPENWQRLIEVTHKARSRRTAMALNLIDLAARRLP